MRHEASRDDRSLVKVYEAASPKSVDLHQRRDPLRNPHPTIPINDLTIAGRPHFTRTSRLSTRVTSSLGYQIHLSSDDLVSIMEGVASGLSADKISSWQRTLDAASSSISVSSKTTSIAPLRSERRCSPLGIGQRFRPDRTFPRHTLAI